MVVAFLFGVGATLLVLLAGGLLAFKIFRRGPLTFTIDGFFTHVLDGDPGPFIRDVRRDAVPPEPVEPEDPMSCSIRDAVHCHQDTTAPDCNVLLLSGGGQWGAFGAGLFDTLGKQAGDQPVLPGIGVITGISTGSLQTVMLMVALDPKQTPEMRRFALDRLVWGYSPSKESDVVDHTGLFKVPLFGAAAGTKPLRKRVIEALMPDGDARLVEAIGQSSIAGYAGFVEAQRGIFRYADLRELVTKAPDAAKAAEALAAATMASSAMPVFHQQLRIAGSNGVPLALYDGGVRRSVFFDRAMAVVDREVRKEMDRRGQAKAMLTQEVYAQDYEAAAPTVYVVRNGPTVRKENAKLNDTSGPLENGQRAYDLLVNESEIGAIAGLRLNNPYGRILLTTADQYDTFPSDVGENFKQNEMFKPAFMARLRDLGRFKAERAGGPWWDLSQIEKAGG